MANAPNVNRGPRWFILRSDGLATPLIPADELPGSVILLGVSRRMSLAEARGMEYLGEVPWTSQYQLASNFNSAEEFLPGVGPVGNPSLAVPSASFHPVNPFSRSSDGLPTPEVASPFTAPQSREQSITDVSRPTTSSMGSSGQMQDSSTTTKRPLPPSGVEPDKSKKQYCTHWIKTGECNYTQQGCLYKHEIPDLDTLRKIGFSKIPTWYVQKQAQEKKKTGKTTGKQAEKPKNLLPVGAERMARSQSSAQPRIDRNQFSLIGDRISAWQVTNREADLLDDTRSTITDLRGWYNQPGVPTFVRPVDIPNNEAIDAYRQESAAPGESSASNTISPQTISHHQYVENDGNDVSTMASSLPSISRDHSPTPSEIHPRHFVGEPHVSSQREAIEQAHNRMAQEVAQKAKRGNMPEASVPTIVKLPGQAPAGLASSAWNLPKGNARPPQHTPMGPKSTASENKKGRGPRGARGRGKGKPKGSGGASS